MGSREWDHHVHESGPAQPSIPDKAATPGAGLVELQRQAGNAAVCRLLGVQRQPLTSTAQPSGSELNLQLQQKMGQQPPDFHGAVQVLDQMNDGDRDAEIRAISPTLHVELFKAALRAFLMTPPPHRVTDTIHAINGAASRQARIEYFREVVGASDWRRAALTLNGFSNPDILEMYTNPRLPVPTLTGIRDAAVQFMAGWNSRVVDPIHDLLQAVTADAMGAAVGSQATWVPSRPGSGDTFDAWASAASESAAPTITPTMTINCWEMVLLVAYRAGTLSWRWIHETYVASGAALGGTSWFDYLARRLTPRTRQPYNAGNPGGPAPARGDIVLWNGVDHVGLAMGGRDGAGRVKVYSFWPPPQKDSIRGTMDGIKETTVEQLTQYIEANLSPPPTRVEFGPGPW
ncbi:hypothetical protein KIPE111705_46060 [Kibdelosporangium persicum]|uniref:CHAP domain-containing protein n=1 Tax=Kibdelosporangium persicum TaxID=2698649 RepID=A0ABX2FBJ2_9PSEU|nr:hypothetical protein [Kibdelosporangium persicum]NRN68753.1 hypothetical protein [Kibdelosporangium persicum]